jgi:hypothetical protein
MKERKGREGNGREEKKKKKKGEWKQDEDRLRALIQWLKSHYLYIRSVSQLISQSTNLLLIPHIKSLT